MLSVRTKRNNNRLLTARTRLYNFGGAVKGAVGGAFKNPFGGVNGQLLVGAGIGALGSAVGQIGGGLIGGGLESGAGSAISNVGGTIGSAIGMVNPVLGGVVSAASGLIGGLTNRMFGSKMNKENIAKVEGQIGALNSFESSASSFDLLTENWGNAPTMAGFSNSYIGKDGWFSSKAKKKARALREQMQTALAFRDSSLANNADNLVNEQAANLLENYAAYGGYINRFDDGGFWETLDKYADLAETPVAITSLASTGATLVAPNPFTPIIAFGSNIAGGIIDAYQGTRAALRGDWRNVAKNAGELGLSLIGAKASSSLMKSAKPAGKAGLFILGKNPKALGVSVSPSNVNKVNKAIMGVSTGVGSTSSMIEVPDNTRVATRRIAEPSRYEINRLALLEGVLIKAFGGELGTNGADFTNGIILINEGGTHESNPNEGVLFGVDSEGVPNLVEEGEVIFRDYVFSNRIKVPKLVRERHKLKEEMTFADAAKELAKESEERPNDPISQNGLEYLMGDLMTELEMIKAKRNRNKFRNGGRVGRRYDGLSGTSFLFNPTPVKPLKLPTMQDYLDKLSGLVPITIDSGASFNGTPLTFNTGFKRLKSMMERYLENNPILLNFDKDNTPEDKGSGTVTSPKGSKLANLRYVPALGAALGVTTDLLGLTNKPDYDPTNMVLEASRGMGSAPLVRFSPIGNYLTYNPMDREYYINRLNAEAGASRRAIGNSGGTAGSRMAAMLAGDNNYLNQLGSFARQAEEYNLNQRQQVENFNRATNQFNSEGAMKADIANAENAMKSRNMILESTIAGAKMRLAAKDASDAARSANLTNLFDSLGDIGREEFARNTILSNPANYYSIDAQGRISYKIPEGTSAAERAFVRATAEEDRKSRGYAKGGYLTIKKGRRR